MKDRGSRLTKEKGGGKGKNDKVAHQVVAQAQGERTKLQGTSYYRNRPK